MRRLTKPQHPQVRPQARNGGGEPAQLCRGGLGCWAELEGVLRAEAWHGPEIGAPRLAAKAEARLHSPEVRASGLQVNLLLPPDACGVGPGRVEAGVGGVAVADDPQQGARGDSFRHHDLAT